MGVTQGTYTMDAKDPSGKIDHDHGSYVTMYRKQADGSWKAQLDIVTSEVPMPAPAAAADSK
jgi:ketosteroid isomerase-like protein